MIVFETERILLRRLTPDDAPFILQLLNEPSWLKFIGDKQVRTLDDARAYIERGPAALYERLGFGPYLAVLRDGEVPMGICGLYKRDTLPDVDLGFAFVPAFWGKGYAREAAAAVLAHAQHVLHFPRILALTSPDNERSARLLEALGFHLESVTRLSSDSPEVKLFVRQQG
ncbi:GNAT family N-acetyltransferase [Chondromyces apiculatus]|nr:GNAT family N-acetyltransferase [Chondromyces apiculatus]